MSAFVQDWGKFSRCFHIINIERIIPFLLGNIVENKVKNEIDKVIHEIDSYIEHTKEKKVFFRISTLSPKDYRQEGKNGPVLYASTGKDIIHVLMKSERVLEDIEIYGDKEKLCLREWISDIDMKREYRILIIDNKVEYIVNTYTFKILSQEEKEYVHIINFVNENLKDFPEEHVCLDVFMSGQNIVFIEFNPVDNELDSYLEYEDLTKLVSLRALEILNRNPIYIA